ncbi:calcium-binding protein [Brevundimonas sp.]|uniref:calcium-binding protein n=1 Tax=Brevundimonas sp. TaxID=1871086 RepID=UPI0025E40CA9|nr:calcium-binding protein [Brevundimonas sp.]
MPTFSAPGAGGFEMRSGEPGASISSLFLGPPESSASDTVSAVRYSHYAGVEVLGDFTDFDAEGWPNAGTITTIRYYVLGTPGDPTSRQLLYEVTDGDFDAAAFLVAAQSIWGLLDFLTAGGDRLEGGDGDDNLVGGAGDDVYVFNSVYDWSHELADGGYDTVLASTSYTLRSHVERLVLTGSGGHTGIGNWLDNEILGNDDGNRLSGELGDDLLDGGAGDDILIGGAGDDVMVGGEGNDTFHVDDAGDQVIEQWGDGFDRVFTRVDFTLATGLEVEELRVRGSQGLSLTGNEFDNRLIGGSGDDTLNGHTGDDEVRFATSGPAVVVDLSLGIATGQGEDRLRSIENVRGTMQGDTIHGNGRANTLTGDQGDDLLYGRGGDDLLVGGDGSDELHGGAGNDVLSGGAGVDTLVGSAGDDILKSGDDSDDLSGGEGIDVLSGGSGDDLLRGGDGNDVLRGGSGFDGLNGGEGLDTATYSAEQEGVLVDLESGVAITSFDNDYLISIERVVGSQFDDWLIGGFGDDRLNGSGGHDLIGGGFGNDRLTGGSGDDLFYFEAGGGLDTVTDFVAGAGTEDQLTFEPGWFDDFADVLAHASDTVSGVVIAKDGISVRLLGVTRAQLHEDDFVLCGCPSMAPQAIWDARTVSKALGQPLVLPGDGSETVVGGAIATGDISARPHWMDHGSDWMLLP